MNRKVISTQNAGAILGGAAAAMGVTFFTCAACAWLIAKETMGETASDYCIPMILILSSFAGGKLAIQKLQQRRLVTGILVAAVYVAVLLAVTALFFGGQYHGIAVTVPAALSGGAGAAILGNREKRRSAGRNRNRKHR